MQVDEERVPKEVTEKEANPDAALKSADPDAVNKLADQPRALDAATGAVDAGTSSLYTSDGAQEEAVKDEQDGREGQLTSLVEDVVAELTADSSVSAATVKPEPSLSESTLSLPPVEESTSTPEPESVAPAAAAKKKASSTVKKESSSSSTTSKSKKSTSPSKKASSSAHPEASFSRRTVKIEETPLSPAAAPVEDEEEEDTTLYCICQRQADDVEGGMIMCDRCDQWYHYRCMGITEADVELVDQFICPPCHEVTGESTTYKAACAREGCRRAALREFSKYCSDRCGGLAMARKLEKLGVKVERDRKALGVWEADRRVEVARKTEAFIRRTEKWGEEGGEWQRAMAQLNGGLGGAGLGVADAFALMVSDRKGGLEPRVNGVPNGVTKPAANGWESPLPEPNGASTAPSAHSDSKTASSATDLISIDEQLTTINRQLRAVELEESSIGTRLDRLDLRRALFHLVFDRVYNLPPANSSNRVADEDEEMPDSPPKKSKKKKGSSKSKSSDASDVRCGYDQRLHWDDAAFDSWASTEPGRSILANEAALDGSLDEEPEGGSNRVVCGTAKRKCRRHTDWTRLFELALDAERAPLVEESLRKLGDMKMELSGRKARLEVERVTVGEMSEEGERRKRKREEERDRDLAIAFAAQGTRRGAV